MEDSQPLSMLAPPCGVLEVHKVPYQFVWFHRCLPHIRTQEVLRAGPGTKWEALFPRSPKCRQEGRGWKEERRDGGREGRGRGKDGPEGLLTDSCDACKVKPEFCTWLQSCQVVAGTGLGLLPSARLFTWEGLIGKEMSPGCEYVTKAGAEMTSL